MTESTAKRLSVFERYLTVWVGLCMVAGVALGKLLPGLTDSLRKTEFGEGSHINVPIAVLIWLMIYPMMLKIDFTSILGVGRRPRGLVVTLIVNWLIKPFSMAFLGWLFFKHLFLPLIGPELADQYIAGVIILAAAPCTAMVFVWSYLTDGDPAYTLVQVSVNDLIMLVAFAPIVTLLVSGASSLTVPFKVLVWSVILFIVIPLALGSLSRALLIRARGKEWFEGTWLPLFHPVAIVALLVTLVLIFAFQADNLLGKPLHVVLIAIPILVQVYFNAGLAYGLMKLAKVPHAVAAPGALIGASNFFELAVATAIALYGPGSGAALATVVGVLVEVPVMLTVCSFCNRTRGWFEASPGTAA
jgi:ACR3 family arsenite transporter